MSSKALSLMKGMLNMEVSERLTALDCLSHPFFDGMHCEEIEIMVQGHRQAMNQAGSTS